MGARIAFLATAMTTGLDPLNIWPDPIACVYEALNDLIDTGLWYPDPIPGPSPAVWAQYIDPEIPQTILMAEDDQIVHRYDDEGNPINGQRLFELLPSRFAQMIVLSSGSTPLDRAEHQSFMCLTPATLDAFDWWGHLKIVAGLLKYHFDGGSRQWAYGFMRWAGGVDRAGKPIVHEVFERHNGVEGTEGDGENSDSQSMRGNER
jgi:hypothetical protein